jgi:hypothetical protein
VGSASSPPPLSSSSAITGHAGQRRPSPIPSRRSRRRDTLGG